MFVYIAWNDSEKQCNAYFKSFEYLSVCQMEFDIKYFKYPVASHETGVL